MIILRTHPEHIPQVVAKSVHALKGAPTIAPGDLILISVTIAETTDGLPPIRYVMEFDKLRADRTGETSRAIWGKRWPLILYGRNCRQLVRFFDIRDYQVSGREYGQGGPFVYVDDADEAVLWREGLLA